MDDKKMALTKDKKKNAVTRRFRKELLEFPDLNANKENPEKSITAQFLLTEYDVLSESWRHTDARIETGINIYLTVCAFVFPGLGLLYQASSSIRVFIFASIPVAIAMFIFGFFLVQRITSADFNKSEYKLGMQIIRRYFADKDPEVALYLYGSIASSVNNPQEFKKQRSPYFHKSLALAVYLFNSLLAGALLGCLIWLVLGSSFGLMKILSLCFVFSVIIFSMLNWQYWRRIKHLIK